MNKCIVELEYIYIFVSAMKLTTKTNEMITQTQLKFNDIVDNSINNIYAKISNTTDSELIKMYYSHVELLEGKKYKYQ